MLKLWLAHRDPRDTINAITTVLLGIAFLESGYKQLTETIQQVGKQVEAPGHPGSRDLALSFSGKQRVNRATIFNQPAEIGW